MRIFTNTAISLDGKITTRYFERLTLGSREDWRKMSEIRNQADAVVVGGKTFRNWVVPLIPSEEHINQDQMKIEKIWNVVVTRSFDLPFTEEFLNEEKISPLVITDYTGDLSACPVPVAKFETVEPEKIVNHLKSLGIKNVLIEGGGELIFQFLKAGLVDDLYVTLCPWLIGGTEAPSLVSGEGFLKDEMKALELLSEERIGDEIFLHYKVLK